MKNLITLIFLYLLILPMAFAQVEHSSCATTVGPEGYQLLVQQAVERSNFAQKQQSTICTLKLQPYVIRSSGGAYGLYPFQLDAAIVKLNEAYGQVGFYFEQMNTIYIYNDTYFNDNLILNSPNEFSMASSHDPNAVNVYFVPKAGVMYNGELYPTNWSCFPFETNKNWIVINNSFATQGEDFAHVLGHYFNLIKTNHNYFDYGDVDGQNIPRENVTRDPASSCYNADVAGDLVTDTPADPGLATWTTNPPPMLDDTCGYIGTEIDGCGLPYTPDTRNIMNNAYYNGVSIGCRINFTEGQRDRMHDALQTFRPAVIINCTVIPDPIQYPEFVRILAVMENIKSTVKTGCYGLLQMECIMYIFKQILTLMVRSVEWIASFGERIMEYFFD